MNNFTPTPTRYAHHLKRWRKEDTSNRKLQIYLPGEESIQLLKDIDEARDQIVTANPHSVWLSRSDFIRQALRFALDHMEKL